jgi:peroxiredoxin
MAEDPEFTLTDQAGQICRLAEYRDAALVLAFYRGDW